MRTILFMGQSNAIGRGDGGLSTFGPLVNAWNNQNDLTDTSNLGSAFVAPSLAANPFVGGKNNIGIHMANKLAAILGEEVRLILVAKGGESIDMWTNASGTKGAMYTRMEAILAEADVTSIDIFAWHQGENDDASGAGTYEDRFDLMIGHLAADGYIDTDTPVIVGTTASKFTAINPVLSAIGNRGGRFGLTPLSDLPTYDTVHFPGSSLVTAGRRYVEALSRTETEFEGISPYGLGGHGLVVRDPLNALKLVNTEGLTKAIIGERSPLALRVIGTSTPGDVTYSASNNGWFFRMGDLVVFYVQVGFSGHTGTGTMILEGLPYPAPTNDLVPCTFLATSLVYPEGGSLKAYISEDRIRLLAMEPSLGGAAAEINVVASASFYVSGMYATNEPL